MTSAPCSATTRATIRARNPRGSASRRAVVPIATADDGRDGNARAIVVVDIG